MKQVCVLGNGQLGRMLRQAGEPLGIAVWPVGLDAEPAAVPFQQSVITAEIERWPETALTRELARHPAFVNRDVFPIIADRLTQKQLFDKLHLPTAPWQLLAERSEWPAAVSYTHLTQPTNREVEDIEVQVNGKKRQINIIEYDRRR